jgi:tetratricopeptide (TPR) repeat protein
MTGAAAAVASADDSTSPRQAAGVSRTVRAGFAHHQAGRLDRAEALYRRALAKDPDQADALHLLGVVAYQCGRIGSAIELIERALPALPDLPDAHLNYGNALRDAGRAAQAVESYRRAVALRPDYGMAHSNLARVLVEQHAYAAGLESARRAIELIPDFLGAWVNCAGALLGLERYAEAEAPLRRALELMPERAETHSDLGAVLTKLLRLDEALACHRQAIALNPDDAAIRYALGATLYRAEDLPGSEASFRRALALAPNFARPWHGLGNVLRTLGRFEEAQSCFRRALELDPNLPDVHRSLAVIGQQAGDDAELQILQAVLADPERPASNRIAAGFALGTLLDNADRYDEAFPFFAEANALYRRQQADAGERFDPEALRRDVDGLIGQCTPALFSAMAGWGNLSQTPVFIVGMPRSGTSLVEQIAASHSRVFGAGERRELSRISDALAAHNRGKPVAQWDAASARRLADEHVAHLGALGGGAARVIDKMPDNVFTLWLIAALFPAARIVLCQRDPRDICLSCYFHWFAEGNLFAYDLVDCGLRAIEVERIATHWLRVLPLEMLAIDYEELVEDPEGESRRLIEFLGLDWEPACLDFHRTERPVFTASSWQVRQPLFTRSAGRWRHYERHLSPLLQVLAEAGAEPD